MPAWYYGDTLPLPRGIIALLRQGVVRETMRKDDDYLRELLFELEAADAWVHYIDCHEDDAESCKRYYHALLLADAGALAVSGPNLDSFRIRDQGYTLIGVMRDETAWRKLRSVARAAGARGVVALVAAAEAYAVAQMKAALGLPSD